MKPSILAFLPLGERNEGNESTAILTKRSPSPSGRRVRDEGITAEYNPGKVTVKPERGHSIVIIKEVSAQVCDNCGEYILDESVTKTVMEKAEQAVANNAEVEVLRYVA